MVGSYEQISTTQLRHNCDTTATQLRHNYDTTASQLQHNCVTNAIVRQNCDKTATQLRHNCDTTTTQLRHSYHHVLVVSHFGKKDFELGIGGEGQDTSRHFEGSFGSIRAILPIREASELSYSYHSICLKKRAFKESTSKLDQK